MVRCAVKTKSLVLIVKVAQLRTQTQGVMLTQKILWVLFEVQSLVWRKGTKYGTYTGFANFRISGVCSGVYTGIYAGNDTGNDTVRANIRMFSST